MLKTSSGGATASSGRSNDRAAPTTRCPHDPPSPWKALHSRRRRARSIYSPPSSPSRAACSATAADSASAGDSASVGPLSHLVSGRGVTKSPKSGAGAARPPRRRARPCPRRSSRRPAVKIPSRKSSLFRGRLSLFRGRFAVAAMCRQLSRQAPGRLEGRSNSFLKPSCQPAWKIARAPDLLSGPRDIVPYAHVLVREALRIEDPEAELWVLVSGLADAPDVDDVPVPRAHLENAQLVGHDRWNVGVPHKAHVGAKVLELLSRGGVAFQALPV